jgi:hypothetical protein
MWQSNGTGAANAEMSKDERDALEVVRAVGPAEWVASVTIDGRERGRAEECASVATTVALDSLGLSMDFNLARNFRGPGEPIEGRLTYGLSQFDGRKFNQSSSSDFPYIGGRPGSQSALLHGTRKLRDAVGDTLADFIALKPQSAASALKRRWVEAMYWYGQARRERTEFIALVKTGVAMDVLAKGGQCFGILQMACAVLGMAASDPVTTDGRSLKSFVEKLYNEGRSKIAHGGSLALLSEMPLDRHLADTFAGQVLIGYVACLQKYTGPDRYEEFLVALPSLRLSL